MPIFFLPYEITLELRKKDFKERCLKYWLKYPDEDAYLIDMKTYQNRVLEEIEDNCIGAPLYQQVIDWFRIDHKLVIDVCLSGDMECKFAGRIHDTFYPHARRGASGEFEYYEALNKTIIEAIKII